jgi:Holliday junction DNA helicase RuvA
MYSYIIGKVVMVDSNSITLENNGIGYLIYTPNPYAFTEEVEYKIYLYQQIKEDEHVLFGFKTIEEKELFLKLIDVKGLGPKMALPIIAMGSITGIADAINRENILYLKKFPKIGDKLARQMILDLKGKLQVTGEMEESNIDEVYEALLALGYKDKDIKGVISRVNKELSVEEQIKEALRLMIK